MQRRERVLPDIGTVQKDGAWCAVVETREEIDKRRLTRSTRADDRGDFAGGDGCTQVVEHLARLCVAEIEVGDLDFVRDPSEGLLTGGHDKFALVGEEPRHGLQTRKFLGNAKAELADHFVVTKGLLKWEEGSKVCLGVDGRNEWAYDFALESVRENKLAIVREILGDYEADGIELDFMFGDAYFKPDEADAASIMSRYMSQIRSTAREIGDQQDREIPIMVRVCLEREDNLAMGLDVEAWLADGSVDFVVGQDKRVLGDTQPMPEWLPVAANAAGGAAYYRPPRRVYDERTGLPSIEMTRALSQTLDQGGYAGLYHGYMRWPLDEEEYRFLREAAFPEVTRRKPKRYYLQPREGVDGESTTTPERQLPVALEEGKTERLGIWVADDVDGARADGEMRKPILTLRFSFFCIDDDVEFRFNGRVLAWEDAEITDERGLTMATKLAGGMNIQAPLSMSAHWFRFRLERDEVRRGENTVEVECHTKDGRAGFTRSLNGVEILMRYRDMERPEGLGIDRVEPGGG